MWETAEQRYSRLDPQTQVLAAYMVAFGARVSNHERIVGCIDCPLLLTAVEGKYTTSDLEYWGQRRASVCDALRTHADHLFNTVCLVFLNVDKVTLTYITCSVK